MSWLFSRRSSDNSPRPAPQPRVQAESVRESTASTPPQVQQQPTTVRVATRPAFKPFGRLFNFMHAAVITETGTHSLGNPDSEPAVNYPNQYPVQATPEQAQALEQEIQKRSVRRPGMGGVIDYLTKGNCQDVVFQSGRESGVDIPPEAVAQRFNDNPSLIAATEQDIQRQRTLLRYTENPVTGEPLQPSYLQAGLTALKNAPTSASAESMRQQANTSTQSVKK